MANYPARMQALGEWLDRIEIRGISVTLNGENAVVNLNGVNVNNNRRNQISPWANNYGFTAITWIS